jgi:hypothetical protein
MRKMFHGTRFYAVQSRDAGAFGRARVLTIKIYRSTDAGSPAAIIADRDQMAEFTKSFSACGENRSARDDVMSKVLSNKGLTK